MRPKLVAALAPLGVAPRPGDCVSIASADGSAMGGRMPASAVALETRATFAPYIGVNVDRLGERR